MQQRDPCVDALPSPPRLLVCVRSLVGHLRGRATRAVELARDVSHSLLEQPESLLGLLGRRGAATYRQLSYAHLPPPTLPTSFRLLALSRTYLVTGE